jgi:hypothetical protein
MHQDNTALYGTVIILMLAVFAVSRSDKKWRALLVILGWTALGLAIGTGIGFAAGSPAAAGSFAAVLSRVMAAAASIKKILDNRKAKTFS